MPVAVEFLEVIWVVICTKIIFRRFELLYSSFCGFLAWRISKHILFCGRVIKSKEQVVSGMMYHLTEEAIDAGKKKIYEAKVWVKPWMNFKKLEEFRHTNDFPSLTSSDLGVERDKMLS